MNKKQVIEATKNSNYYVLAFIGLGIWGIVEKATTRYAQVIYPNGDTWKIKYGEAKFEKHKH